MRLRYGSWSSAPIGATARAVRESRAGLVVPAEDPAALLREIDRAMRGRELYPRLTVTGRRFADKHLRSSELLARAGQFVTGLARPVGADGLDVSATSRGVA